MSRTHDDDAPVEHDPTGVRALLASLPDPGPMPDDLVARITAALEAEVAAPRLSAVPALPPAPGGDAGRAPSSSAPGGAPGRRTGRRPTARHLAVAAAVVATAGIGGLALQVAQGGLRPSLDSSAGSSDSGAAMSGQEENDTAGGAGSPSVPEAGSAAVLVVATGRSYTVAGLGGEVLPVTGRPPTALRELAAEAPSLGPIATSIGARTCATALGVSPTAGVLVDVADVDGRPAAVLVVTDDNGRSAWAVERSCTTGAPGLLAGPVPVG